MAEMLDPALLPPPSRPVGWRFLVSAILVCGTLLLSGWWVAAEYRASEHAGVLLRRSYERRILIADLMSELKDAETGQRGYLLTGDPAFLAPYRSAAADIADRRQRLVTLVDSTPRHAAQFRTVSRLIDRKLLELRSVLDVAAAQGLAAARRTVRDNGGNPLMERTRAAAEVMMRHEDTRIAGRYARWNERSADVQQRMWVLVVVLMLVSCAALQTVWRMRRTRYRLQVQAQEATARLRGVFAGTSDAIALIDADGAIEAVNPAVTRMLGHDPSTLIGRDVAVLIDVLPAVGPLSARLAFRDGQLIDPLRLDRVAHHADGHEVPVDVALGLMPVPAGLHMVATIRDISDRKAIERIKDEFVATVSHELRTPLTSIVGALGLLRATSGEALPDGARRLVLVAEENSRRLIDLVNDLLDIERMDAGGVRFRSLPVDLAAVLQRGAQGSEGLAAVKDVRIEMPVPNGPTPVQGDEGRLAQVVTNLLANAIRFSPRGGVVTIRTEHQDGRAVVTVEDRGPGVPEGFRDRLFTRFAQSDETGLAGGTGLGLAISRQIMRAHRGTIGFAPRPGGGARFYFSIALRAADADAPHVLICAAQAAVAGVLRDTAEAGGCIADRVASVADAQAALRSGGYDAVLLCLGAGVDVGTRLLAILNGAAIEGRLSIPVAIRSDGVMRVGSTADMAQWMEIPASDPALAVEIQAQRAALDRGRPLVLHVDGDGAAIDRAQTALQRRARVRRASSLAQATGIVARETPTIVILDQRLPDGDADMLIDRLAALPGVPAVIILYSERTVPPALERRADIVVTKTRRSAPNLIGAVDRALAMRAGRASA